MTLSDLSMFLEISPAQGNMMIVIDSDDAGETNHWNGYRIDVDYGDLATEVAEMRYPGISKAYGSTYFYRKHHGSSDIIHFAFQNCDPGNNDVIYNTLVQTQMLILVDDIRGREPNTFIEMLAIYMSDKY